MKRLVCLLFVACATPPAAQPIADVSKVEAVAAPAKPRPVSSPADDWHDRRPAPIVGREHDGKPLYPAVRFVTGPTSSPCRPWRAGEHVYVLCERDLGRVEGSRIDFDFGRKAPLDGYTPIEVEADGSTLWVHAVSGGDGAVDAFSDAFAATLRYGDGKWTRWDTSAARSRWQKGWLAPQMPAAKVDSKCPDASCQRVLPSFVAFGATAPDFSALSGTITWIHPNALEDDFAVAIDPDGPVYVLMRALDLKTKRRGFGVATWTPKSGARFDWLPGPLGTMATESAWSSFREARDGKATFVLVLNGKNADREISWDGHAWSVTSPRPGPRGAPAPNAPEVSTADDAWVVDEGVLLRTVQPDEVFTQTVRWGRIHAWPAPASDDCATPFAVLDRVEPETLAQLVERTKTEIGFHGEPSWGVVDDAHRSQLVQMRTSDGLVVIGVAVRTKEEGEALVAATKWTNAIGLYGEGEVVCARPIDPKPFSVK